MGKQLAQSDFRDLVNEQYIEAINAFNEVIKEEPTHCEAHGCLALCYLNFQHPDSDSNSLHNYHFKQFIQYNQQDVLLEMFYRIKLFISYTRVEEKYLVEFLSCDKRSKIAYKITAENSSNSLSFEKILLGALYISLSHLHLKTGRVEAIFSYMAKIREMHVFGNSHDLLIAQAYVVTARRQNHNLQHYAWANQFYQHLFKNNPDLPIDANISWATVLYYLGAEHELLYQLKRISEKALHPGVRKLFKASLKHKACLQIIQEEFFPALSALNHPHFALFWQMYIDYFLKGHKEFFQSVCQSALHQALSIYPNCVDFYQLKGRFLIESRDYKKAKPWLLTGIALYNNLGKESFFIRPSKEVLEQCYDDLSTVYTELRKEISVFGNLDKVTFPIEPSEEDLDQCYDNHPSIVLAKLRKRNLKLFYEAHRTIIRNEEFKKDDITEITLAAREIYILRESRRQLWNEHSSTPSRRAQLYNIDTGKINPLLKNLAINPEPLLKSPPSLSYLCRLIIKRQPSEYQLALQGLPDYMQSIVNDQMASEYLEEPSAFSKISPVQTLAKSETIDQTKTSADFDSLIEEIKCAIYSYLSFQDLCQVSLLNSKENKLAQTPLWNARVKVNPYVPTTRNYLRLFFNQLIKPELDLFVNFRIGEEIDAFLVIKHNFTSRPFWNAFDHYIIDKESTSSFLIKCNSLTHKLKNRVKINAPKDLKLFEQLIENARNEAIIEFNTLLTNPDTFSKHKLKSSCKLLCSMDAYRALEIIYKKSKEKTALSKLFYTLCYFKLDNITSTVNECDTPRAANKKSKKNHSFCLTM